MVLVRRVSRIFVAMATLLTALPALAHVGNHAAMSRSDSLLHLLSDPTHAVLGLAILAFALFLVVSLFRLPRRRRTAFDLKRR